MSLKFRYDVLLLSHQLLFFFFFNDTATTEIYTLSLHDAPPILPSALSNSSSTEALPTGLRAAEPLNTTSAMLSPRRCLADSSPITQRTASMTFDLPQPFGPTTPVRLLGKLICVGSTKDLKPASLILVSRIVGSSAPLSGPEDGVV